MLKTETRIGWCPRERAAELRRFIDEHWKKGHVLARDEELLAWQYGQAASADELSVLIAEQDERIVGMLGLIVCPFNRHGKTSSAAWLTNWIIVRDEAFRSVGLELLKRAMSEGFELVGTLGANAQALSIFRLLRFHIVPAVNRWVGTFQPAALGSLLSVQKGLDSAARDATIAAATLKTNTADGLDEPGLVQLSAANSAHWDRLWEHQLAAQLVSIDRSTAYLNWRYLHHPRLKYEVRVVADGQQALGLIVYRLVPVQDRTERVLRIVDLLYVPGAEQALAQHIRQVGSQPNVAFVEFYCTTPRFTTPLLSLGLVEESRLPTHLPSLFQPLDARRSALTAAFAMPAEVVPEAQWSGDDVYFTRSDCDQDRPN